MQRLAGKARFKLVSWFVSWLGFGPLRLGAGICLKVSPMRLTAVELHCHRGGRTVFTGVSFAVSSGEALIVTGRNGAGKSSLLRTIAGLLRSAQGRLSLDGGDPEMSIGEKCHYVGHQDAIKPSLSVAENLRFWAEFFGAQSDDTADGMADDTAH